MFNWARQLKKSYSQNNLVPKYVDVLNEGGILDASVPKYNVN
ncbi:hypothetical protein HMPREF0494_0143 [Limosilactobacillus antri DSM 16041]|uniref:Uncharacterized protein n=1 Tax=Limosilactobacillus antri DSM 16041 TaxID=525309 RepID=C8P499_9LACO|nr:hypothetical protein HMPREF0494_0143 [Limosilactobacillus antri DSM 16041]